MKSQFIHKVSKGSRFNQIYIPKNVEGFEVGDTVEVRLLKKYTSLYYSHNLKISEFKEKLITNIFSFLSQFKEISQIFIFGSFLTTREDYNDIDILIITPKEIKKIEERIYNDITNKFNLKFHIISISERQLNNLVHTCPMTRSMLYSFVSNKKFSLPSETRLDKNHIKFLLMMPEDLLDIKINSKVYYDNIRRLITIERFLEKKDADPLRISSELERVLEKNILKLTKDNESINENILKKLKEVIINKLKNINSKIK
ncbi:MAG: nucleotidyltransferase domain-containing protein [Nanoarchaeota archaeon]